METHRYFPRGKTQHDFEYQDDLDDYRAMIYTQQFPKVLKQRLEKIEECFKGYTDAAAQNARIELLQDMCVRHVMGLPWSEPEWQLRILADQDEQHEHEWLDGYRRPAHVVRLTLGEQLAVVRQGIAASFFPTFQRTTAGFSFVYKRSAASLFLALVVYNRLTARFF